VFLDRDWNPKIKRLNTFSIIFSLCNTDFVFSCKKKVPSKSDFFLFEIGREGYKKIQTFMVNSDPRELCRKKCAGKKDNSEKPFFFKKIRKYVFLGLTFFGTFFSK
jgi:hypothetical protein